MKTVVVVVLSILVLALGGTEASAGLRIFPEIASLEGNTRPQVVLSTTSVAIKSDKAIPFAPQATQQLSNDGAVTYPSNAFDSPLYTIDIDIDPMTTPGATLPDLMAKYVRPLEQMSSRDPSLGRPPLCRFTWGRAHNVRGVIVAFQYRLSKFQDDGSPGRVELHIVMRKAALVTVGGSTSPVVVQPAQP
jgi:hypothetical protein